ncbi:MAG: DNA polymerase I, partial [Chitinivibrionales bacterium]|nr:DNA polymerase I [Chitinivibrionales bacterium]
MDNTDRKELYLVDGHALAYRAYFATIRTPMSSSKGQATGAVFGFTNSMLKLLGDRQCAYVAVVFDGAKPTFRHEMYPEYKADREAMPDDMRSQMPLIFRLVEALNLPRIVWDGIEADDVIAWLTKKAAAQGFRVWLVTKDKDLMQLVDDNVHLLAPEVGGGLVDMGPDEVQANMGVAPGMIRDLLALMGDTSDNVPGVPGIGPKTAAKILAQAGSVEKLLEDPSLAGTPKLREKIEQHLDDIVLSRKLVTLHTETDLDITLESLRAREMNKKACVELFSELEFNSLLRNPLFDIKEDVRFTVEIPPDIDAVRTLADEIENARFVCVDTETTSTEAREAELVGISLAMRTDKAYYIPVGHTSEPGRNLDRDSVLDALRPVLESDDIGKTGHNLKYDYQVFRNHGCVLRGLAFDTMVAAYLIDPGKRQYSLDAMAAQWLGMRVTAIESLIGKRGAGQLSFAETPIDDAAKYAGEDVVVPLRLRDLFVPILRERHSSALFADMEMPLVTVLADMEWHGITIDTALLAALSREYGRQLEEISQEIYGLAGEELNLNSPKQISEVFYVKLGMPKSRRTKTGMSTDVDALARLAPKFPIARRLLDYRELQKLVSTYIDALPQQVAGVTGRVHTSFNQTIAATGRLSSANPNLQNIPVRSDAGIRIREAFTA